MRKKARELAGPVKSVQPLKKGFTFLFLVFRMREKKGEGERFAITTNWKKTAKAWCTGTGRAPLWFVCILSE